MTSHRSVVVGWVQVGDPDLDAPRGECGGCGFDSVLTFPLYLLTPRGVWSLKRTADVCGRCGWMPDTLDR